MTDSSANPFAPPRAEIADIAETRVLPPARKPIAVWAMQGLGVVAILWWCGWLVVAYADGSWLSRDDGAVLLTFAACTALFVLYFGVLVRDCQKRQRRGRRMGLMVLSLLLLLELPWLAGDLLMVAVSHRAGGDAARLVVHALPWLVIAGTLAWGWRFAFAPAARAWFGVGADASAA